MAIKKGTAGVRQFRYSYSSASSRAFSALASSAERVMPLPIFLCSGPQSRMSYLGSLPFGALGDNADMLHDLVGKFGHDKTPLCLWMEKLPSVTDEMVVINNITKKNRKIKSIFEILLLFL